MKKKKKKKKQRDSLAVRLVSLSFSLVDSNFFIFVCCGLLRQRTSEGAMVAEKWKRGGVLKCSEGAAKVFNINVFGQFSFMTKAKAYIYLYVWVSLFRLLFSFSLFPSHFLPL